MSEVLTQIEYGRCNKVAMQDAMEVYVMADKKQKNNSEMDSAISDPPRDEKGVQQMLGRHRDESAEEREPAFYHFSKEELEHREDLVSND